MAHRNVRQTQEKYTGQDEDLSETPHRMGTLNLHKTPNRDLASPRIHTGQSSASPILRKEGPLSFPDSEQKRNPQRLLDSALRWPPSLSETPQRWGTFRMPRTQRSDLHTGDPQAPQDSTQKGDPQIPPRGPLSFLDNTQRGNPQLPQVSTEGSPSTS